MLPKAPNTADGAAPTEIYPYSFQFQPSKRKGILGFDLSFVFMGCFARMPLEKLTRARIIEALNLLGELAVERRVELELCIFGGSALLLAYGARNTTKDVDALIRPVEIGKELSEQAGKRAGLDPSWLNDDVKRFISNSGTFAPLEIEELELAAKQNLKISRPSASYLLAMKCLAARPALPGNPGDFADLRFLIEKMNLHTIEEVEEHVARFYPHDCLTVESRESIRSLLKEIYGGRT